MSARSIGVVSLLGEEQALTIWDQLNDEYGPQLLQRHRVACGDARTFQGRERDVMFLSLVCAPNDVGAPLSRDIFAQRFNVAASRARDRMYLVRSVDLTHLSEADRLRRSLIGHFAQPFPQDRAAPEDARALCESPFERELYDWLMQLGYRVTPQVRVGAYASTWWSKANDARLAIESATETSARGRSNGHRTSVDRECSSVPAGCSGVASQPHSCAGAQRCSRICVRRCRLKA
jgi:hypothetical protein